MTAACLAVVSLLPDFLAINAEKLVPVTQCRCTVSTAQQNAVCDVVEAVLLVWRLPAQINAPAHLARLVHHTAHIGIGLLYHQ